MENFHEELSKYVGAKDSVNATKMLMAELGNILVKNRTDFVNLLNGSGVPASEEQSDAELVKLYIDNIEANKKLILGTALLVNIHNKEMGVDGEQELSDRGVKCSYSALNHYFCGSEKTSGAGGAIMDAIKGATDLAGKFADNQHAKKFGSSDALQKKQDAKNAIVQSVLAQRQAQAEATKKKAEEKAKTTRMLIIAGGSLAGLALLGTIIWYVKYKKK